MKISKLEYVKMQIEIHGTSIGEYISKDWNTDDVHLHARDRVDAILKLNGITVADEAQAKPLSLYDWYEVVSDCDHDIDKVKQKLQDRGLVIA